MQELNRRLAELLGWTTKKNSDHPSYSALVYPDGWNYLDRDMPTKAGWYSDGYEWNHVPDFCGDGNACLWAWEHMMGDSRWDSEYIVEWRVGRNYVFGKPLGCLANVKGFIDQQGCVIVREVGIGKTELEARVRCLIAVLEALGGVA